MASGRRFWYFRVETSTTSSANLRVLFLTPSRIIKNHHQTSINFHHCPIFPMIFPSILVNPKISGRPCHSSMPIPHCAHESGPSLQGSCYENPWDVSGAKKNGDIMLVYKLGYDSGLWMFMVDISNYLVGLIDQLTSLEGTTLYVLFITIV